MSHTIRKLNFNDWHEIKEIYLQGIRTGNATFQTEVPTMEEWFASHVAECSLGYYSNEVLLGWAALSNVSSRCVYNGVAELSIYIREDSRGRGIGGILMENVIEVSEDQGYWTLQAGIFPENKSSIRLHTSYGFREVGRREKLGRLGNKWRDVILFERRSKQVGQE